MDAQTALQSPSQDAPQRRPLSRFRPGVSGNPSGKTRTQTRTAEFLALFRQTHGRAPSVVEATQIKAAGAMAARVEANRTPVQDQVRCANVLSRLLAALRLDGAPAKSDGAFPQHGLDR